MGEYERDMGKTILETVSQKILDFLDLMSLLNRLTVSKKYPEHWDRTFTPMSLSKLSVPKISTVPHTPLRTPFVV